MIEVLASLILPALVPVATDGIRALFNRFTNGAGAHPANVDEVVKLLEAQAKHAEAMAKLDAPGGSISRWVADLRASFRYIAAGVVILGYFVAIYMNLPEQVVQDAAYARNSAFSFIFGDRMYTHMRRK